MIRLMLKLSLLALTITSARTAKRSVTGVGLAWDVTPADRPDYHPVSQLGWYSTRLDDSALEIRTVSGTGQLHSSAITKKSPAKSEEASSASTGTASTDQTAASKRKRRDTAEEADKSEKINSREGRNLQSSESSTSSGSSGGSSWSKPLMSPAASSYDRRRFEQYDDGEDNDEAANLPPLIRAHYSPKTDFVTSGRGRSLVGPPFIDKRYPEGRESRDLPISRAYDDYDVPVFRNVVREHDFDVQLPRVYPYPQRYRTQRDYYYRGVSPYYDRHREGDDEYEVYGRYRPTPKPKRIIYYATLPEIVRKPIDLRNYQRPYDAVVRAPEAQVDVDRNRVAPNALESIRRPLQRHSYDNYDNYVKRSSYYDRRRPPYAAVESSRSRDSEKGRPNFKDRMRAEDKRLESQLARSGDDRRAPWPMHIGAEVNVKENDRVSGRKIFGQNDNYDRYNEGQRLFKKISDETNRKEMKNEDTSSIINRKSDKVNLNN